MPRSAKSASRVRQKYRFTDFNGEEKHGPDKGHLRLNRLPGRWRREISG